MAAADRCSSTEACGDLQRQSGEHYSSGNGLRRKLAVVGSAVVAWLRGDGSALLLQHHVVAQSEADVHRLVETTSEAQVVKRAGGQAFDGDRAVRNLPT